VAYGQFPLCLRLLLLLFWLSRKQNLPTIGSQQKVLLHMAKKIQKKIQKQSKNITKKEKRWRGLQKLVGIISKLICALGTH